MVFHEGAALAVPGVAMVNVATVDVTMRHTTPVGGGPAVATAPDTLALLIYTSGTTGKPKGVMLDHANLTAMVGMITEALGLTAADRCLLILPLFHVNGILVSVLSPLAVGGCTSVTGRFSPSTFFDTVEAVRPTYFSAVPAIYAMLTALPDDIDPDTSSVRFAVCGAAPMPTELIERFEQRYGPTIVEGYGLSECTCAATINPVDGLRKPGTVGLPMPDLEVAVLDGDSRATTNGQGEVIVAART